MNRRAGTSTRTGRRRRPAGGRYVWRWLAAAVVMAALMGTAIVAGMVGVILGVTHEMPALASMQARPLGRTTFIYDRNGHVIARLHGATNRVVVNSERIPALLKQATVAIEDKRFYRHHGVDPEGIARAALADLRAGRIVEGGSTITEQYVKNVYTGGERTVARKLHEALLAWQLEDRWSKDQILTAYLNTVYYGGGSYGVQAAAQTYFHRDVSKLSLSQCALLAALTRFPSEYSPLLRPAAALQRRNLVLAAMRDQGYISARRCEIASRAPLGVSERPPAAVDRPAGYFVEYVVRELQRRFGADVTYEGGLRVYTSIDMRMQRAAITALKSTLPPGPAGALVAIDPRNGQIRAMVASTDWRKDKFNLAWQATRQLGSVMKPFALAAAVEMGLDPETTYYVSRPLHIDMGPNADPPYWDVATYGHTYSGSINLVRATLQSDNTVYAQLALDIGPSRIVDMAHRMGITSRLRPFPSLVLGTESVNPLEVADAYATFASGGVHHPPRGIVKVVFPDGRVVQTETVGERALSAGVAYTVTRILQMNTRAGTAAAMPYYYSGVAAGKTGTTSELVDAWFAGFNTRLATAVWMGFPKREISMPGVQGATYCVPIWGKFYNLVFGARPTPEFPVPKRLPTWKHLHLRHAADAVLPTGAPSPTPSASASARPTPKPSAPQPSSPPAPAPEPTAPVPEPTVPVPTPAPEPVAPSPTAVPAPPDD